MIHHNNYIHVWLHGCVCGPSCIPSQFLTSNSFSFSLSPYLIPFSSYFSHLFLHLFPLLYPSLLPFSSPLLQLSHSDTEKLCLLLAYYGGRMQRRLDSKVTHLVTMETRGVSGALSPSHPPALPKFSIYTLGS